MIEEMIMRLTEQLYSRASSISYRGIYFPVREEEYSRPMDFSSVKYISIAIPEFIGLKQNCYSITYEMLPERASTNAKARENACFRLATHFVKEVLPKLDYEIEKELHNRKIEEILDVLD